MQRAHTFFNRSPKRLSEFQKLAEVIETKGLRPLQNITTRWISLLEPLRRILSEYCTLIVKMTADQYDYADAKVPQTALFVFLLFFFFLIFFSMFCSLRFLFFLLFFFFFFFFFTWSFFFSFFFGLSYGWWN
jgi:hypothetical protein